MTSEYDTFGTAHSSTSISAALGMAVAARLKAKTQGGRDHGDGAVKRRHGVRAMNNAGVAHAMLVVLNDSDMSIAAGRALNRHLARLMSGKFYAAAR